MEDWNLSLGYPSCGSDIRGVLVWGQVLESRVDHTRVVLMLRKAGNLPLVKDYLIAVQKANLSAVNEAVNELVIEEEDFEVCPHSIVTPGAGKCTLHCSNAVSIRTTRLSLQS